MTIDASHGHDDVFSTLGESARLRIRNRVELDHICRRRFGAAERLGRHQRERRNQVQERKECHHGDHEQHADCPLDNATHVHTPPADPALPGYVTSGMSFFRISS